MLYLIALYSLLSALAIVLDVMHGLFVSAFCVAILSLFAVRGGSELKFCFAGDFIQKIGRVMLALVIIIVSLHLSLHYNVNLFYRVVNGTAWSVLGIAVGFLTTSNAGLRRARMTRR